MRPIFDTKTGSEYTRTVRSFGKTMIVSLLSVLFALLILPHTAWSASDTSSPSSLSEKNLSIQADSHIASAADSCIPLLSSFRHASPQSAPDRNQHSAGKAAAIGLMLGVRYALAPTDAAIDGGAPNARSFADGKGDDRYALAVAAYRQCQKEQALQALSAFRWSR